MNINKNFPIIICGSGRSGTTWVLDSLTEANNLQPLFEPLHPAALPEAALFDGRYVKNDADEPQLYDFMGKVFSGQINNIWTRYRILPDRIKPSWRYPFFSEHNRKVYYYYRKFWGHFKKYRKFRSGRMIVKFIRANLMIGWLHTNFRANILLLIRHPGAIVNSKLLMPKEARLKNWDYRIALNRYLRDESLMEAYLFKFKTLLNGPLNDVKGYTIIWCIENMIPIIEAKKAGICITFYENLVLNPEYEWRRVTRSLGLERSPGAEILSKPSHEAPEQWANESYNRDRISKWQTQLNREQLQEIEDVLHAFGVGMYSAFKPLPLGS